MKRVKELYYNKTQGAAGALLGPDKFKENQPNLSRGKIKEFFQDDPIARLFYGKPKINKKKHERNTSSSHPLQIIHMDLISFVNDPDIVFKYGLTCVDSYSRYALLIPLESKTSKNVRKGLTIMLKKFKPFRRIPSMTKSIFYCDLGKEFTSNRTFLEQQGHRIVFAASGKSKAYFAERFHAVIRKQLTILRLKEGSQKFLAKEGWAKYAELITNIHNKTKHSSLNGAVPSSVLKLIPSALKLIQSQKSVIQGFNPYQAWISGWRKQKIAKKKYLEQYVRLVVISTQTFAKKSQQYQLGYELFKVSKIRPTKGNHKKSILLHLTDRENEPITGAFRLDEVQLVPKTSIFHPDHPSYKPCVGEILEKVKINKGYKYKVKLAGNTYIHPFLG